MASLRTWRTVVVALLLVVLATTATTTTAGATTFGHQERVHYCKPVDAYRIKTCATALLPDSPLGRQLRWVLDQLAGEAATLTEAEVRAHVSAEFLTIVMPAPEVVQALRQTIAERGTFTFVGFAYPPRAHQALALIQSTTGERGAVPIGVTNRRPALISRNISAVCAARFSGAGRAFQEDNHGCQRNPAHRAHRQRSGPLTHVLP